MKITLLSPYSSISAFGLRSISACLKREGHDVKLIFLPQKYMISYEEETLDELVALVRGSNLIGISLMTNYFDNVVKLTQRLRQIDNTAILWGGIHATIRPEECLNFADMVCIGEGEETVLELATKMQKGGNCRDIQGVWFKDKERFVKNELRPLIQDLDSLPYQDYNYDTHYILRGKHIYKMNEGLLNIFLKGDYLTHPTRGCPFGCTYCCNNTINKMYPDQKPRIRKRSINNIINELVTIKNKLPFINHITFDDDAFFSYAEDEIGDFCEKYKYNISLPLDIRGANPATFTRKKLSFLVDAGLTGIRLGIQTASERTKKLYKRYQSNQQVEECVQMINKFEDKIKLPRYDIIVNNPWEKNEDLAETLMFFAKFPKPYLLNMFSLTFYPGTELYNKAVEDGIITNDLKDVYRKSYNVRADGTSGKLLNETYFNNLFYLLYAYSLTGHNIPIKMLSLLVKRKSKPLKSRLAYFVLRLGASLLLKKRLGQEIFAAVKEEGLPRTEYDLD
jgi:radical SAM superfamily enzyme YgiQ (UPF0313 family)